MKKRNSKLNRFTTILLTTAAIAASTSATRADELSDLVAAVAADMQKQQALMQNDVAKPFFGSDKPRYQTKKKKTDLNTAMLDGIFSSMKRESFRRMRRELFDDDDDYFNRFQDQYMPPTLGRADFYRPVPGVITSNFGWRPRFQRVHHGVDLSLQVGDTVRAAVSGTVEKIAYDHGGYGNYVVMTHPDGMETLYGHLSYALVGQGQFVYAGQPVGIGGNTGNSTGPHLHFETRLGGIAIDPTSLFDFYGRSIAVTEMPEEAAPKVPRYSHQSKSLKKESTYIVRFGDTLESIAAQAGMTVMRLCQLNMLNQSDPLTVGRMLKLK